MSGVFTIQLSRFGPSKLISAAFTREFWLRTVELVGLFDLDLILHRRTCLNLGAFPRSSFPPQPEKKSTGYGRDSGDTPHRHAGYGACRQARV